MSEIQGVPPSDIYPEKAIPLPSPPTPKIPSAATLKSWLPLYLQKSDASLLHLSRILSTPSGTDTLLLFLCYTTLTTSSILTTLSLHRLHKAASKLIKAALTLPPNATLLISTSSLPPPRLLQIAKSLKALSSLISDFRIFARLWGLLGIYKWGRGVYLEPPKDRVLKGIAWSQVLVNVAFQGLENAAYLASKGVLGWDGKTQDKAWLWSCRFWAVHVGLDLGRLAYLKRKGAVAGDMEAENEGWWKEVLLNLAWAPMTMHWSLEGGLLGDLGVGVLGSTVGVIKMNELWKATA